MCFASVRRFAHPSTLDMQAGALLDGDAHKHYEGQLVPHLCAPET